MGMDRKIEKKRWTVRNIALISIGSMFGLFALYNLIFADNSSKLNVEKDKITVSTVQKGNFTEYISVTGVVQPLKTIYLDAREGGYVSQKLRDGGVMIDKGDTILKLE